MNRRRYPEDRLVVRLGDELAWLVGVVLHATRPRGPGESGPSVMGRSAVAVVTGCLLVPALLQLLTPLVPSQALEATGDPLLPVVWAATFIAAAVAMGLSYWAGDPANQRAFEIGACVLVIGGTVVYIFAVIETTPGFVSTVTLIAISTALVVNLTGRTVLLVREVRAGLREEAVRLREHFHHSRAEK